jgi:LPXTG-motif cell wall-anchored protein
MSLSAPHQAQSTGAVFLVDRNPDNPSYVSLPAVSAGKAKVAPGVEPASSGGGTGTTVPSTAAVSLPNTAASSGAAWPTAGLLAGAGVWLAFRRRSRHATMRRDIH